MTDNPRNATQRWTGDEHAAYLESRGEVAGYNPAAEYGDPDWREPASDAEAAARVAYLDTHRSSAAPPPRPRDLTEVERAIEDAAERAVLADRAHDPDPAAWAEYERLLALDSLTPLPTQQDDHGGSREGWAVDEQIMAHHLRDEAALGHPRQATPAAPADREGPIGAGLDPLSRSPSGLGAGAQDAADDLSDARRDQLNRWHQDDQDDDRQRDYDASGHSGWGWDR